MTRKNAIGLVVSLVICLGASGLGASFTTPQIDGWYATLTRPTGTPPNWVFAPVWTLLFLMMSIAVWLVWKSAELQTTKLPLMLFSGQLILNVMWSALFFGLQNTGFALIEIVILWFLILATTCSFYRRSLVAGSLMVPYLMWVGYATYLNYGFWSLNQ